MEVVAKRGDTIYLVADDPNNNLSPGKIVDIERKLCEQTPNIQIPIKFGYWEEVTNVDQALRAEIMAVCDGTPNGLDRLFDFMQR